jgi:hypothetical protein
LEVDAYDLLHRLLPFARCIDQIPVTFDEKIQTIGLKGLIDERALDVELSLYVIERGANLRKLDTVATTNGGEDMRLDKVDEGQILPLRIIQVDQRPGSLRLPSNWIPPAHHPTAQGPFRHTQVVASFSNRVRRRQAGVVRFVASFNRLERHPLPQTLSVYRVALDKTAFGSAGASGRTRRFQPSLSRTSRSSV